MEDGVADLNAGAEVFESNSCQPLRTSKSGSVIAFRVYQPFISYDFRVNASKGVLASILHAHHNQPCATHAKVDFAESQFGARAAPPPSQVLGFRPCLKQEMTWPLEDAGKSDLPI
jgi:hypothetical protein